MHLTAGFRQFIVECNSNFLILPDWLTGLTLVYDSRLELARLTVVV